MVMKSGELPMVEKEGLTEKIETLRARIVSIRDSL